VVKAWEKGSKDAETFWAKAEKPKPKTNEKSEALPGAPKPGDSKESEKDHANSGCDPNDIMFYDVDPNTIPPC